VYTLAWVVTSLPDPVYDPVEPADLASFAPELATSIGLTWGGACNLTPEDGVLYRCGAALYRFSIVFFGGEGGGHK
jgi:hypothetical protein